MSSQVQKNIFPFCVIIFEPIEVQTRLAPQNSRQNLSFVKDIFVDGGKLARNGQKTAIRAGGSGRVRAVTIDVDRRISYRYSIFGYV